VVVVVVAVVVVGVVVVVVVVVLYLNTVVGLLHMKINAHATNIQDKWT